MFSSTLFSVILVTICHYVNSQEDEYYANRTYNRRSQRLHKVPDDIPDDALKVYLDKNRITSIPDDTFSNLSLCAHLYLNWNELSSLNKGSFNGLISLLGLYLKHNKFLTAPMEAFSPLRSMTWLELDYNQISAVEDGHLHDLIFLIFISLDGNKISEITDNFFLKATKRHLRYLELESNEISAIDKGVFNDFGFLLRLDLKNNQVSSINVGDLNGLVNLRNLTLESNQINTVEPSAFVELIRLERLWLNRNLLENLQPNTFIGLKSLKFLDLGGNRINSIDYQVMAELPRPLMLGLGPMHNHWVCKIRLCWLKLEEEAGTISWAALGGYQRHPVCVGGSDWSDLSCPNPVPCRDPRYVEFAIRSDPVLPNTKNSLPGYPFSTNTMLTYTCDACYTGGGSITCQSNGQWTRAPSCLLKETDCHSGESVEANVSHVTSHMTSDTTTHTTFIGGLIGTFLGGIAVALIVVGGIIFYIKRRSAASQPANINSFSIDHGEASVADYMEPVPCGTAVVNPGGESVRYTGETEGWRRPLSEETSHYSEPYGETGTDFVNPAYRQFY